jgi:hypothetical protein
MTIKYVFSRVRSLYDVVANHPQERLTAKEAMAHAYFAPIRDEATLKAYLGTATVSSAS